MFIVLKSVTASCVHITILIVTTFLMSLKVCNIFVKTTYIQVALDILFFKVKHNFTEN